MSNPQERQHFYIGYLLGILDADGSFQLGKDGKGHYIPEITIANTNNSIIEKIIEALKFLGLTGYVWTAKRKRKRWKPVHRVVIKGIKRVARTLELLNNYNFGKKDRALVLKEFCDYRLSIPHKKKYLNIIYRVRNKDRIYGEKEDEFKRRLTLLNMAGIRPNTNMSAVSSETIRQASKMEEDIVRAYTKV